MATQICHTRNMPQQKNANTGIPHQNLLTEEEPQQKQKFDKNYRTI